MMKFFFAKLFFRSLKHQIRQRRFLLGLRLDRLTDKQEENYCSLADCTSTRLPPGHGNPSSPLARARHSAGK